MLVRCVPVLVLLVGGCSDDPASEGSGDSGGSGTTSGGPSGTTRAETNPPTTSDSAGSGTSTTGAVADSGTGLDPDTSDSSETGTEPAGSPGCTAAESLADGEQTLMLDGYDRRYILRLPQGYSTEKPWPLIFALHGNGGDPGYWDEMGGDRDIRTAFADEAIIVIPEAIDNQWRDYNADPSTWPERIELELNYFDTIYDAVRNQLCIDDENVFSMGFSGGGSFSGVLGCRRDYIRAIAVGGSVIYFEADQCVSTPAAWITIGDGELTAAREEFRDFFRDLAGCSATSTAGEPEGCVDYDGCTPNTPVTFCSHPADHVWPSIGTDATKAFFQRFYSAP
jgi:polyhydroxybutyrate depolymerase